MDKPVPAPTLEETGLSPVLAELLLPQNGLILFSGMCGHGISSLQAGLARHAAERPGRRQRIVRISEAEEFDFSGCTFGDNTLVDKIVSRASCETARAIGWAQRSNAHMLSIDSQGDDGLEMAMESALTGHLVHLSRHGNGVIETLQRMTMTVDPCDLAFALRAVVSRILVPRVEGKGRVPVHEILVVDPELSIRMGQADPQLWPAIIGNPQEVDASGRYPSTFATCCRNFYISGIISLSEAARIGGAGVAD